MDATDDGRGSENSARAEREAVLEAARLLARYRRTAARRNRIALVCVGLAMGLTVFAVAYVLL
ncbi:hypothetical protein ACL02U_09070 [Streptomyces sp. MS06]|uniref:hypothetical protein n=1 Tax=Streptomyces sp. MS06 TaxID=3385974 RepID=UPI0039A22C43